MVLGVAAQKEGVLLPLLLRERVRRVVIKHQQQRLSHDEVGAQAPLPPQLLLLLP